LPEGTTVSGHENHPVAILYGLSVLDAVNQIAFAAAPDAKLEPPVVTDLDERTAVYERISGAPGELLNPLAVAEFAWRDASMAVAKSEPGAAREIAKANYERSAKHFLRYINSVLDEAAGVVEQLTATFKAAMQILSSDDVANRFGVAPIQPDWVFDNDVDNADAARSLAALSEELEPEPFGRLSAYEVELLKRLAVERRTAVQQLVEDKFAPDGDPRNVIGWHHAHNEFQLASVARATRGQQVLSPIDPSGQLNSRNAGFLPQKVIDFMEACAAAGT
jgi:hypothetical protein